jgi:hypothetical protein
MNCKLRVFIFSCKMGRVDFFSNFFLKNRVGWIFFPTYFLKKGWVGSKPPTFFLKHQRVANYNIGRLMHPGRKILFKILDSRFKTKTEQLLLANIKIENLEKS